jgi:hypothetical protein
MGRQISVAMDLEDEDEFLRFLRSEAEIELFRERAPSPEALAIPRFVPGEGFYWIHNRRFPWVARSTRFDFVARDTGLPDFCYMPDHRHAPLLEYLRHPLQAPNPMVAGRLYWSKFFTSQPGELSYDVAGFDRWFTQVMRWVRKHGEKLRHGRSEAWFLPAARQRLLHER